MATNRNIDAPYKIKEFFLEKNFFVYKKGETILRQGDEPSGVYYLEKGYVKAYTISVSGEEKLYYIYKKDEIFPIGWVLNDLKNTTQYVAMTKTILRRCSKPEFINLLEKEKISTVEFSQYLTEKISLYAQRVSNLATTNSYSRIIIYLLFIAKRLGIEKNGKIYFDFPVNQADIAASVNVTRETASKELSKLKSKKLIDSSIRSKLVIYDFQGLEQELESYYEAHS